VPLILITGILRILRKTAIDLRKVACFLITNKCV